MNPTLIRTSAHAMAYQVVGGVDHLVKVVESKKAPYPAYDVFVKLPDQKRGKHVGTVLGV